MTMNEAYDAMQEGLLVSHKLFKDGEFLYMDDTYIIKDENGYDYETSWDKLAENQRFSVDWYIYKDRDKTVRGILQKKERKQFEIDSKLISHVIGKPCPGRDKCLQRVKIAGETACLICDANADIASIDYNADIIYQLGENEITTTSELLDTSEVSKDKKNKFLNKIKNLFRKKDK